MDLDDFTIPSSFNGLEAAAAEAAAALGSDGGGMESRAEESDADSSLRRSVSLHEVWLSSAEHRPHSERRENSLVPQVNGEYIFLP